MQCTMSWSSNQGFIKNHWVSDTKGAEKFIAMVINCPQGGTMCSKWKRMQLLSAVGELLVGVPSRRQAALLWGLNDAAVITFVGEWLREVVVVDLYRRGDE